MPARYGVRLRGVFVWASDEGDAVQVAHQWLDYSDKSGIDPEARAVVERIADQPVPEDLLATTDGVPPDHPSLLETYAKVRPTLLERIVERLVVWARRHP